MEREQDASAVARAFAAAIDRGDDAAAAELMHPDVEVVFPARRVIGREAWLTGRRSQPRDPHLEERFEDVVAQPVKGGVELAGRLVQRWTESGETAHEQPFRVLLLIEGGLVHRFELLPG